MQSVPITTKVVSSNPVHGEMHSLQHYVTCNRSVVFSGTPVSSTNKTERHDITESGVKHHEPTNLEVSDYCITPNEQIFSISWREQVILSEMMMMPA